MTAAGWVFTVAAISVVVLVVALLERGDQWRDRYLGQQNEAAAARAREQHTNQQLRDVHVQLRHVAQREASAQTFIAALSVDQIPVTENHDDPA